MKGAVQIPARFLTRTATLMALAVALSASMAAQESRVYRERGMWVEEISGSLPAAGSLSIRLFVGNVNVQGGNQSNITYTLKKRTDARSEEAARREFKQFRFSATKPGDVAVLDGQLSGDHTYSAELVVQVPRSIQLVKAVTHGGNETIGSIGGRVEVSTAGGNLHLDDIGGSVTAASGGGNVEVGTVGGNLAVKTGGGTVRAKTVKGRVNASSGGGNISIGSAQLVSVQTGGGEIEVKECTSELTAQTGGGSLDLGQVGGKAILQSAGGSIHMLSARGPVVANTGGGAVELYGLSQGADVETGAGQITAEFLGASFTGSNLETPSGDIIIYLGPNLKASVRAAIELANGHRIRSDFPEIKVTTEGGQYGPKMAYAEGSLNGGGPVLRVRAVNGDIEFRRARK